MQGKFMLTKSIIGRNFMPYTGEPIDLLPEDRETQLHGTFVNDSLHTRYADNRSNRDQSRQRAVVVTVQPVTGRPRVKERQDWIAALKRIAGLLPGIGNSAAAKPAVRGYSEVIVRRAHPAATSGSRQQRMDSNQISS
jgi:hypothetical protein